MSANSTDRIDDNAEGIIPPPYRRAGPDDAGAMADLVNFAGEGMPAYLWSRAAEPGQSAHDVGTARAKRDEGAFSWRNTIVRQGGERVSAALVGYPIRKAADPADYDDMPPMFVPLQELEDLAKESWYVNVLAAYPEFRGRGYGSALLDIAHREAARTGCGGLSLIVSDANEGARRLYARKGYDEVARRRMVKEDWENAGTEWILLARPL